MTSLLTDPLIVLAVRGGLCLLFGFSILHKLSNMAVYRQSVADYRIAPQILSGPIAVVVLLTEVATVGALLSMLRGWPFLLAAALLSVYASAMFINLARGRREIDCGCGGPPGQTISGGLVARNLLIAGIALAAALAPVTRTLSLVDAIVAFAAMLIAALLYSASNQLMANQPRLRSLR